MSDTNSWVELYTKNNFETNHDHQEFDGPNEYTKLRDNNGWDNKAGSLKTGSNTWAILYDDAGCDEGFTLYVGPNAAIDLEKKDQPGGDDWDNAIESMQVFNTPIVDLEAVKSTFRSFYSSDFDSATNYYEHYTQNVSYRLYNPNISYDTSTGLYRIRMRTEYSRTGGNDAATIDFCLNAQGAVDGSISITYDMHAGAIPNWVIKLTDAAIKATDTALKIAEDGIEVVLADAAAAVLIPVTNIGMDSIADVLIFAVDHVNAVLKVLGRLMDDGGSSFYAAENTMVLQRLIYSFQKVAQGNIAAPLTVEVNQSGFENSIGASFAQDGTNKSLTYTDNDHHYRMWEPQTSSMFTGNGIVCSCKIDHQNDNTKDNHLGLVATYNNAGDPVALYASVLVLRASEVETDGDNEVMNSSIITYGQDESGNRIIVKITTDDEGNRTSTTITNTNNLVTAFKNSLQSAIDTANEKGDFENSTLNFPSAAVKVINSWKNNITAS